MDKIYRYQAHTLDGGKFQLDVDFELREGSVVTHENRQYVTDLVLPAITPAALPICVLRQIPKNGRIKP